MTRIGAVGVVHKSVMDWADEPFDALAVDRPDGERI